MYKNSFATFPETREIDLELLKTLVWVWFLDLLVESLTPLPFDILSKGTQKISLFGF